MHNHSWRRIGYAWGVLPATCTRGCHFTFRKAEIQFDAFSAFVKFQTFKRSLALLTSSGSSLNLNTDSNGFWTQPFTKSNQLELAFSLLRISCRQPGGLSWFFHHLIIANNFCDNLGSRRLEYVLWAYILWWRLAHWTCAGRISRDCSMTRPLDSCARVTHSIDTRQTKINFSNDGQGTELLPLYSKAHLAWVAQSSIRICMKSLMPWGPKSWAYLYDQDVQTGIKLLERPTSFCSQTNLNFTTYTNNYRGIS